MLSNSCRYGIRAVIYLAKHTSSKEKTDIRKISSDLDLPAPFLAKILQQLAKHKILRSSKGPHGGFSLLEDPRKINLLDIVNTIDGQDIFTNCIMHNGPCKCVENDKIPCPIHADYASTRAEIIRLFSSMTIFDLVQKSNDTDLISI